MLNYNPSALTDNKTLLEKLNEILLYLKENPFYKIYQTTDSYRVGGVFSVQNVIMKEGEKLENKDMILFSNGYIGVVTDLTETTYKIVQAVNLNGPQGKPGIQGPQGPQGESGNAIYFANAYIDAQTTDVLLSDIEIIAGRNIQINDMLMSSYLDSQGAIAKVTAINENIINIDYIGTFTGVGVKSISITEV